jgi:carbon storage regulator
MLSSPQDCIDFRMLALCRAGCDRAAPKGAGRFEDEFGGTAMLVLSRKNQESVVVGSNDGFHRLLKVTVLEIQHGRVRLGFEVDQSVPVHRSEVWERIGANGQQAMLAAGRAEPAV